MHFTIRNASILAGECFILPSYPELTEEELEYIVKAVKEYVRRY